MAKKKRAVLRKKVAAGSRGLAAPETKDVPAQEIRGLAEQVVRDGGAVLGSYRDPFGGKSVLLVALPIDRVEPTPYQRDPSEAHVKRLMNVIDTIGRFVDPIVAIRQDDGYWTPNGNHRLQAMKKLGAKSIIALLVPEPEVAFKILALNTEKAHNVREKSLETIKMARALAKTTDHPETAFAFEFEMPSFLTLGAAYEDRPRLSGGAYQSVLRRIDDFLEEPLSQALKERARRAKRVLKLDDAVTKVVDQLKERGLTSPYLKPFVLARIDPTRFSRATSFDFDEVLETMTAKAGRFNVDRVRQQDLARMGGAPPEE